MVSRRRTLQLAGSVLLGLAGCLGDPCPSSGSPTESSPEPLTATPTPDPTTEPATDGPEKYDPAPWESSWVLSVPERHVLGLDPADGLLYATTSDEGGPSALSAIDPASREVVWRTEFEGEATGGSHAEPNPGDDQWGVTLADDAAYSVNGRAEDYAWTELHAVERSSGKERWSFRKPRRLAVRGVADGTVYATGLEFFEPEHSHDTPEEPLTTILYALDADSGEPRWTREFAGVEDVAVGTDGVSVAAGSTVVAVGPDGDERWRFEDGGPARAVFATGAGVYYVTEGVDNAAVHGLDPAGTKRWMQTFIAGDFLLDGDRLYVGGRDVRALEPDGTLAWRNPSYGGDFLLGPDRERLFMRGGRGGDAVDAMATTDGERRWLFDPPYRNAWPVAATADAAVVQTIGPDEGASHGEVLLSVDRADGTARSVLPIETIFTAESLDGTVYVGDGNSSVIALEP